MEEQDSIPAARMVWMRLVLGAGHPVAVIVVALALVGAGICWFSYEKISSLTKTPTRYEMDVFLSTEGCRERSFRLDGDIGSFGPSFLQLWFVDPDEKPKWTEGCRLRSMRLTSNLPLTPMELPERRLEVDAHDEQLDADADGASRPALTQAGEGASARSELIRVRGADVDVMLGQKGDSLHSLLREAGETFRATLVDGTLRAIDGPNEGTGPDFSMSRGEARMWMGPPQPRIDHNVVFPDGWQPLTVSFSFVVPENVKTYFSLSAYREEPRKPETQDAAGTVISPLFGDGLEILMSFRTDDVSVIRGSMLDSGEAQGIDGYINFGIENNDAESRRESGNVTYSAVLGIGIALLVEAFVIVLAIAVRRLVSRPAVAASSEGR